MAGVVARLHHGHLHARRADDVESVVDEFASNAPALEHGVDRQHVDLAHLVFGVDAHAHPPHDDLVDDRHGDVVLFVPEDGAQVGRLANLAPFGIVRRVRDIRDVRLESVEDWLPRTPGEFEQGFLVPWIVWSNACLVH